MFDIATIKMLNIAEKDTRIHGFSLLLRLMFCRTKTRQLQAATWLGVLLIWKRYQ